MGTFTVSASGFANLPTTPPSAWPANMTWPGGTSPNGTKSYTVSDADWANIIAFHGVDNFGPNAGSPNPAPTIGQILLAMAQQVVRWMQGGVVNLFTTPPQQPPPPQFQ
jgi:hypothetical protein